MNTVRGDASPRVAVIGGGLAGLTAAFRLSELARERDRAVEVTLFEAAPGLGGAIETLRRDGYLIERGADSFLTSKPAAVRLCERIGIADELIPTNARNRGALVLRGGRPYRVPDGFDLMAPARIWPVVTTPLLSPAGKLRLLAEAFVPARRDGSDESLASFVRRRLGNEAFERLVQPLVSGIYTADPEQLSLAATLPRFPEMERRHGSLVRATLWNRRALAEPVAKATGARYGLFAGLQDGMAQLFEALSARIRERATILTVRRITSVSRSGDGWHIDSDPGRFDAVILALPAYRSADLLAGLDPELATLLRSIPYASSAVVASGHRLADVAHPLNAFGLVVPAIENRDVLAVSFASRKFPGRAPEGRVLLRTFVGGATNPQVLERSDEDLIALVRHELGDLLGVRGEPEVTVVSRYTSAMPQYHVGHLELVGRIETAAARHVGLELTGSGYRGVGMPDVIAHAERAAESVFSHVSKEKQPGCPPQSGC